MLTRKLAFLKFIYFYFMNVFCLHIYACVPGAHGCQKRALDLLKFKTVVSYFVDAGK